MDAFHQRSCPLAQFHQNIAPALVSVAADLSAILVDISLSILPAGVLCHLRISLIHSHSRFGGHFVPFSADIAFQLLQYCRLQLPMAFLILFQILGCEKISWVLADLPAHQMDYSRQNDPLEHPPGAIEDPFEVVLSAEPQLQFPKPAQHLPCVSDLDLYSISLVAFLYPI